MVVLKSPDKSSCTRGKGAHNSGSNSGIVFLHTIFVDKTNPQTQLTPQAQ
jgi:hypothetical protein